MKNYKEIFLGIATLLFAISGTISFMAQSELNSKLESVLYVENSWAAQQQEFNVQRILRSLCDGLENNSTACYEYAQKSKSVGSYSETWDEQQENYKKEFDESSEKYKNNNLWAIWIFRAGVLFSFIYIIVAFKYRKNYS